MRYFLDIVGLIFFLASLASCASAKSGIHEIGGMVLALIGTVFIVGGVLYGAITEISDKMKQTSKEGP